MHLLVGPGGPIGLPGPQGEKGDNHFLESLLEKLSKDASCPSYTMNKAIRALNAIKGMN
jgi:hypothetical protein